MLYDSQIKKVLKILQQENQNTLDIEQVKTTDLLLTPENFFKKMITISLISGYDFQHGVFNPSANKGKGGNISSFVKIVQGGPNQIVP